LPPAIWIQTRGDLIHDYRDPDSGFDGSEAQRFVDRYRRAGGEITLHYFDAPLHFTSEHPELPASVEAMRRVCEFIHRQIPVAGS
jgi:acetyl esterase/lipase